MKKSKEMRFQSIDVTRAQKIIDLIADSLKSASCELCGPVSIQADKVAEWGIELLMLLRELKKVLIFEKLALNRIESTDGHTEYSCNYLKTNGKPTLDEKTKVDVLLKFAGMLDALVHSREYLDTPERVIDFCKTVEGLYNELYFTLVETQFFLKKVETKND